ncbi:DinB family protein [Fodinibius salsisoli]|uniref:DinB family protein n=1 Tax=Fodinibius salsisoli TaxID=2820877 RepID=A0ABT3PJU4_9BACT|nr:DinB family protein [Fodinibius salsisoli]MCW9706184.1 DinB family protein [Fodinibius salsisoli]
MDALQQDLKTLFDRDLNRLIKEVRDTPDELLWTTPKGISNSCGILVQHLVGNLNHYIGKGIGETGYLRDREREFTSTGISKEKLIEQVEELQQTLEPVFQTITEDRLDEPFALDFPFKVSNRGALMHLYGHLNYHLGQYNYLRRMQSS